MLDSRLRPAPTTAHVHAGGVPEGAVDLGWLAVSDPSLAPVRRLDSAQLLGLVNEQTDARLSLLGPAPGGQVGAAYVGWPDGREGVLTVAAEGIVADLRRTSDVLALARAHGLPVPAYDLIVEVPGAVAIVQERLPGTVPVRATRSVVQAMVGVLETFAGLLADRSDVAVPDLWLRESGPGYSLHRPLELYDRRSRRLLDWVHEVGTGSRAEMTGDDLVHLDFHPGNVLVDDAGSVTGIVDWDGIGRGDRRFGLVTLRFGVTTQDGDAATAAWLDDVLDRRIDAETLRVYWAAMSLREVDWAIRHHAASAVERVLDLAETRMS
jgi:aminoglycoside phosphotransferase (APT) family kinase protein